VRPRAVSAGGIRVVLPAPGGAITTARRSARTSATISSRRESTGSGVCTDLRIMATRTNDDDIDYTPEGNAPPREKDDPTNAGYDEAAHSGEGRYGVLEGQGGVFGTTGGGTYGR